MTSKCNECRYFNETENFCNNYVFSMPGPVTSCEGFSSNTNIDLATFSEEEKAACLELVEKMRAEKAKKEKIQKTKNEISFAIAAAIPEIGLEETKKIVRELNRELRNMPIGES